jgi:tryptophan-rich sensory protein
MNKQAAAVVAVGSVLAAAALGARNGPQRPMTALWYASLRKPPLTPPGPVVGAAWGALELLLAGAGYRLLQARPGGARSAAVGSWALTLLGLAGYPWLFFRQKQLGSSAVASASMLAAALGTAAAARDVDPPAAAMTVPLTVWLGFATFLSEELWRRN